MYGLQIHNINGLEGQIDLVGIRAVVGTFYRWTLERRGEDDAGNPRWTLRAFFSYKKPGFLLSPRFPQVIRIKVPPDRWYEVRPTEGHDPFIDDEDTLRVEEAVLWPVPVVDKQLKPKSSS
jgi:hypothetical protein